MKQNLEKAKNDVNKGLEEVESLKIDNEIKRETKQTIIETYNAKLKTSSQTHCSKTNK